MPISGKPDIGAATSRMAADHEVKNSMTVYTVHEPPPHKDETATNPDRFAFVRDGFYFWAFLFGPLWMLWRRLWLVTVLYLVVIAALETGLWAMNAPGSAHFVVGFLLALLIGFEAGSLRRWTFTRRGWKNLGVVVADDLESAERRFFAAWSPSASGPTARTPFQPHTLPKSDDSSIIGLFPQPGARR
jgi:hypothetical protein